MISTEMLEIEYKTAWESVENARIAYEMAKRNFYDVAGLLMEQYMIKNVDVLERLKSCDTPTI
jgi:hypothetical protein